MQYKSEDLERLHTELLDILCEIIRVCEILDITFFGVGGTAIGVYYNKGFIPWDDDVDLGMTRYNYNRFLKEAPRVLSAGYFLQCFETESDTPFYFAKVRKDNTLFVEKQYSEMSIHHGIFVDVFPFDKIPDSAFLERIQRRVVNYCDGWFKRSRIKGCIEESFSSFPRSIRSALSSFVFWVDRHIPRRIAYSALSFSQTFFNNRKCKYVSIVKMPKDKIPVVDLDNMDSLLFEGILLPCPHHLFDYLNHHYPGIQPVPPKDKQINHAPLRLSFSNSDEVIEYLD